MIPKSSKTKGGKPANRLVGGSIIGLVLISVIFWRFSYQMKVLFSNQAPQDKEIKQTHSTISSPIRFVMFLGLEGTGHHFWQELVKESPVFSRLEELHLFPEMTRKMVGSLYSHKTKRHTALWSAPCRWDDTGPVANVTDIEVSLINLLQSMKNRVQDQIKKSSDEVVLVPVNLLPGGGDKLGMMSYPSFREPCRELQYPNIHVWYGICDKAGVQCDHVYIFRNPWSVIKSTTINRPINKHVLQAIHLYTTQLQILHSQLLLNPGRVAGCWDYDTALSPTQWKDEVEPLLHFGEQALYGAALKKIYIKPSVPTTKEEREQVVPNEFQPYMTTMVQLHETVVSTCHELKQQRYSIDHR
jgi:hypothetical protein